VRRLRLFDCDEDYRAFLRCFVEIRKRLPIKLYAYCVMPNHFHLVLEPITDGDLSLFMQLFLGLHAMRWHVSHQTTGHGAVYQGRFKAFPVQTDRHFLAVCRYVERNPVRAALVSGPELWTWSSFGRTRDPGDALALDAWPVPKPETWAAIVSGSEGEQELARLRKSVMRNTPFGNLEWAGTIAGPLDLYRSLRSEGRPHKGVGASFGGAKN
jgi:putative transposase